MDDGTIRMGHLESAILAAEPFFEDDVELIIIAYSKKSEKPSVAVASRLKSDPKLMAGLLIETARSICMQPSEAEESPN